MSTNINFVAKTTVIPADWLNFVNSLTNSAGISWTPAAVTLGGSSRMAATNAALVTTQWPGIPGSLREGPISLVTTRTAGYGEYGNALLEFLSTAATPSPQFDSGFTSWATHTNLTGGSIFGGWVGANGPRLGQTFSSGAIIGLEINAGNRFFDFGAQTDIGGPRYSVALQLVPDVLPALDGTDQRPISGITIASPGVITQNAHGYAAGLPLIFGGAGTLPTGLVAGTVYFVDSPTANTYRVAATCGGTAINTTGTFAGPIYTIPSYPGSFAEVIAGSIWSHKWWVGSMLRTNSIQPGGIAYFLSGGDTALTQPDSLMVLRNFWNKGIDFTQATIATNAAFSMAAGHSFNIGSAAISGGVNGALGLSVATGNGTLYSNTFGLHCLDWGVSGGAATLGFYGTAPVIRPAGYGTPTNVSKIASFTGTTATTAQIGGVLAALITDLKVIGLCAV